MKLNCPICGSEEFTPKYPETPNIVTCRVCDLVYLNDRPDVKALENLYQNYGHVEAMKSMIEIRNRKYEFLLEILRHTDYQEKRRDNLSRFDLLEIGANWGAFMLCARESGIFNCEAIEVNRNAVEFMRVILGLKAVSGQIEQIDSDNKFDYIVAIHSLEHLPNPATALRKIHSMLKPGGWFCGVVPNIDSLPSKQLGASWPWLDPRMHYTHYTPKTLTNALNAVGLTVKKMFTYQGDGDYDLNDIAKSASSVGKTIQQTNDEGTGVEIRFFAQKL